MACFCSLVHSCCSLLHNVKAWGLALTWFCSGREELLILSNLVSSPSSECKTWCWLSTCIVRNCTLFLLQPHGVHSLNLLQTQCAQFVFSASFITVETMPSSLLPRLVSALDVPHGEMTGYGQFILLPWNTSIPLPHYGMYMESLYFLSTW